MNAMTDLAHGARLGRMPSPRSAARVTSARPTLMQNRLTGKGAPRPSRAGQVRLIAVSSAASAKRRKQRRHDRTPRLERLQSKTCRRVVGRAA